MSSGSVKEYLEAQAQSSSGDESEFFRCLAEDFEKKLWFQISERLSREARTLASLQEPQKLQEFWNSFVRSVSEHLRPIDFAEFAVFIGRTGDEGLSFLRTQVAPVFQGRIRKAVEKEFGTLLREREKARREKESGDHPKKTESDAPGGGVERTDGAEEKAGEDSSDDVKMMTDDPDQEEEEEEDRSNPEALDRSFVDSWIREVPLPRTAQDDEEAFLYLLFELGRLRCQEAPRPETENDGMEILEEIKDFLHSVKERMDAFPTVLDQKVHGKSAESFAALHRKFGETAEFFRQSLLFLNYTPLTEIKPDHQTQIAHELAISALTGKGIYNFGELLQNPIIESLRKSPNTEWLLEFLETFSQGDLEKFDSLMAEGGIPNASAEDRRILQENSELLRLKIRILALVDLVFQLPSEERSVDFGAIEERCRLQSSNGDDKMQISAASNNNQGLNFDEVEVLLLTAFAHGVIDGQIDEIERKVLIKNIQPKILNKAQILNVRDRMREWSEKVGEMAEFMENTAPELLASADSRMAGLGMSK